MKTRNIEAQKLINGALNVSGMSDKIETAFLLYSGKEK